MKLDFIQKAFQSLKTEISQDGETITIFNQHFKDNIVIDYEFYVSTDGLDSFEQYTAAFSYQHRHFENEKDIIQWIENVIKGSLLAIEFFKGDENRFGGEISYSSVSQLTHDIFVEKYGYYNGFSQCDNFKIRSWSGENDYDGIIYKNQEKGTYIVLNKI